MWKICETQQFGISLSIATPSQTPSPLITHIRALSQLSLQMYATVEVAGTKTKKWSQIGICACLHSAVRVQRRRKHIFNACLIYFITSALLFAPRLINYTIILLEYHPCFFHCYSLCIGLRVRAFSKPAFDACYKIVGVHLHNFFWCSSREELYSSRPHPKDWFCDKKGNGNRMNQHPWPL